MAPRKTTTTTAPKTAAAKGAGKTIPPAPPKTAAAAPSLAPADPNTADNQHMTGAEPAAGGDKEVGALQPTPVFDATPAGGSGETADGATWVDEQTTLGRRIALIHGGDGETTTTHEEVIPHGSTDAQAEAARERIRRKLAA